ADRSAVREAAWRAHQWRDPGGGANGHRWRGVPDERRASQGHDGRDARRTPRAAIANCRSRGEYPGTTRPHALPPYTFERSRPGACSARWPSALWAAAAFRDRFYLPGSGTRDP